MLPGPSAIVRVVTTLAITGAAGRIGSVLRAAFRPEPVDLRLLDIVPIAAEAANEDARVVDLRDLDAVTASFEGVERVVHLGGIADEAPFGLILEGNILGTYNVFEAARRQGVRRVVFASSNHATGFYERTERISGEAPPRPDSLYGVSKAFGEALGRLYADKHGLEVACLRIGTFAERPRVRRDLSSWLSHRDAVSLFRACLSAPLRFVTLYGASANTRAWWDDTAATALGYRPQDNAEDYAGSLPEESVRDGPTELLQGGEFVAREYRGRHLTDP